MHRQISPFALDMRRLQEPCRRRSPVFDVVEMAVDSLSIPGLKPVISTIRAVVLVEVKVIGCLYLG